MSNTADAQQVAATVVREAQNIADTNRTIRELEEKRDAAIRRMKAAEDVLKRKVGTVRPVKLYVVHDRAVLVRYQGGPRAATVEIVEIHG